MTKSTLSQLMAIICSASTHQWGDWELEDKKCINHRRCKRCKLEEIVNIEHIWEEWRLFPHQCVQVRICTHCLLRETREIEHSWGDWFINDNCLETKKCDHCGNEYQRSQKPLHSWGEWKNTKEYNCGTGKKIRECEHCRQTEISSRDLIHTHTEWKVFKEQCHKQSICQICGTLVRLPEHSWSELKVKDPLCVKFRECENCGELEYSKIKSIGHQIQHEYELVNSKIKSTRYYSVSDSQNTWLCEWQCKKCGNVVTNEYDDWLENAHPPV